MASRPEPVRPAGFYGAGTTDATLVQGCRAGQPGAWDELVRRFSTYLGTIARRGYDLDDNEAEEAVQDVFAKAVAALPGLRDDSALRPWLAQICRHASLARATKAARAIPVDELDALAPHPEQRRQDDLELREVLSGLSERVRPVIERFFLDDETYDEIAAGLGVPAGTIASRISRGVDQLRAGLYEEGPGRSITPQRIESILTLAESLAELGRHDEAMSAVSEARTAAERLHDDRLLAWAAIRSVHCRLRVEPYDALTDAAAELDDALIVLTNHGDRRGLAQGLFTRAHLVCADERWQDGLIDYVRALSESWASPEGPGTRLLRQRIRIRTVWSVVWGTEPIDRGRAIVERIVKGAPDDRLVAANAACADGMLSAWSGHPDRALHAIAEGQQEFRALRQPLVALASELLTAQVLRLAGQPAKASTLLRATLDALDEFGDEAYNGGLRAELAAAELEAGNLDAAGAEADRVLSGTGDPWRRSAALPVQAILETKAGRAHAGLVLLTDLLDRGQLEQMPCEAARLHTAAAVCHKGSGDEKKAALASKRARQVLAHKGCDESVIDQITTAGIV